MLTSRELKELQALRQRRSRVRSGRFVAEGLRLVEDLLDSHLNVRWVVSTSSLEDSERGRELVRQVDALEIPRRSVSDRDFIQLADTEAPQGVIAVAEIPETSLEDLVSASTSGAEAVVLVLDAVQDP